VSLCQCPWSWSHCQPGIAPEAFTIPYGQKHFCTQERHDVLHKDGKSLAQSWGSSGGSDLRRTGAGRSLETLCPSPFVAQLCQEPWRTKELEDRTLFRNQWEVYPSILSPMKGPVLVTRSHRVCFLSCQ
jgi:hypothetical protein